MLSVYSIRIADKGYFPGYSNVESLRWQPFSFCVVLNNWALLGLTNGLIVEVKQRFTVSD